MKMGTRSVLFGAHQFLIHPWFVALAWWKLYGFPFDPRLWFAFFLHDIGYLGKPNMDGPEGENHVELGAGILGWIFDRPRWLLDMTETKHEVWRRSVTRVERRNSRWREFSLYHSRFYAKKDGRQPSKLCAADKLAVALEPWWLYLPRVILSGEIKEYMAQSKYTTMSLETSSRRRWFRSMSAYLRSWAYTHAAGRKDTWTPDVGRVAADANGVWR